MWVEGRVSRLILTAMERKVVTRGAMPHDTSRGTGADKNSEAFYERKGLLEKAATAEFRLPSVSGGHRRPSALHQARQGTRVFAKGDQRAAGPASHTWRNLRACQEALRGQDQNS